MTEHPYKNHFPDFGDIDVPIPKTFVDHSWCNDACPSFAETQPDGTLLKIWVDYADKSKSELKDEEPYYRFSLNHYSSDSEWISLIGLSNDFQEILDMANSWKAALAPDTGMKKSIRP